jgi:hypothetical protein
MRAWWWLILFLLLSPCASAQGEETKDAYETVAFVGRLISIRPLPDPCKDEPQGEDMIICIPFDAVFLARYEILDMVAGHLSASEIDIRIADHYGFPRFARHPHALLFVALGRGAFDLHKYQGYGVYRTTSNAWASCGDPLYRNQYYDPPQPMEQAFVEDFGPASKRKQLLADGTFSEGDLVIAAGRLRCLKGQPLATIYEETRTGVMRARGIELPAWHASDE